MTFGQQKKKSTGDLTLRHRNVVTSQHRNVSVNFFPLNHKKDEGSDFEGIEERTDESTESREWRFGSLENTPYFVFFFSEKNC